MKPDNVACKNCVFWQLKYTTIGECHKKAPIITNWKDQGWEHTPLKGIWPRTEEYEWCGDFREYVKPEKFIAPAPK